MFYCSSRESFPYCECFRSIVITIRLKRSKISLDSPLTSLRTPKSDRLLEALVSNLLASLIYYQSFTLLRSCFKIIQAAHYGVKNHLRILIYSQINCAFSPNFVLSCTHLNNFKSAANKAVILGFFLIATISQNIRQNTNIISSKRLCKHFSA